jgi:glycosyltransferase involved in cell wall biosynthesis
MRDQPYISIIIPNRNYAEFLTEAIQSVLIQDYEHFEVIVVDDGSTDHSWEVIKQFGNSIRALKLEHGGPLKACLSATEHAKGDYIYILDSDDKLIGRGALSTIARSLLGAPAKAQFPLLPIDEDGTVIGRPFPNLPAVYNARDMIADVLRSGSYLSPPTSGNVYRRDVWSVARDADYEIWTDGIASLVAPFAGEVVILHSPLGFYRVHKRNHSFSSSLTDRLMHERQRFASRLRHLQRLISKEAASGLVEADSCFYYAERVVLEACLRKHRLHTKEVVRALRSLGRERGTPTRKALLAAWLVFLAAMPMRLRSRVASWRESPWHRPQILNFLKEAS